MYRIGENPLTRYPEGKNLSEDKGRWAVAYLKSRREKAMAHDLATHEIGYYLPLIEQRTRRRDTGKLRKSISPLFPGYVAFVDDKETRKTLYNSGHVSTIIPVKDQEAFITELEAIQRILGEGFRVESYAGIASGDHVRIMCGPLTGIEGKVLEWGNTAKILVGVKMFGQSVSIHVEPSLLSKIH